MSPVHVCVHGHFYQPPRENPWLEAIDREASAHPFHDWNERITHECYAPNAAARVLDREGRIAHIVNNYERISFNFGATLLQWLEDRAPETYAAVLEADARSRRRHGGHGGAMAQPYGHVILPLAPSHDKRTQIRWGIADFEARFGRRPEGMWLPETAVDLESLDLMAEHGIRFTVLAPWQAAAVRRLDGGEWHEAGAQRVDPGRPYRVRLPSGGSIAAFFYHGELAHAVAFQRLLASGDTFARRLVEAAGRGERPDALAHIATDGETYGHHHRHGEMALAYALARLEEDPDVRVTNYGAYLAEHPPTHEARVVERTSWSCVHGVERWRSDCGCDTGAHPEWNQAWRAPLRDALEALRQEIDPLFEEEARGLLREPWEARDAAVQLLRDRSRESVHRFLDHHAGRRLDPSERVRALRLLELQRQAMLMFTSCGWFFDDLGGIEARQVVKHAGRAVHLAREVGSRDLEGGFLRRLERARSNVPEKGTGADLYRKRVLPLRVDLPDVGAHYAVTSLFEPREAEGRIYCYEVHEHHQRRLEAGPSRLVMGRADVASRITGEWASLCHAVLHLGGHNVVGGVREEDEEGGEAEALMAELEEGFQRGRFLDIVRLLDRRFDASSYSLHSLFPDEQERIVRKILEDTLGEATRMLRRIYEEGAPLIRFVADLGMEQPGPFRTVGEFALNTRLEELLGEDRPDVAGIRATLREAQDGGIELDTETLGFAAGKALAAGLRGLEAEPRDLDRLSRMEELSGLVRSLPFGVDLWEPQNAYFRLLRDTRPGLREEAQRGDLKAGEWLERFRTLGDRLGMAPS